MLFRFNIPFSFKISPKEGKQKKALIYGIQLDDEPIVRAAENLNIKLFSICVVDPLTEREKVKQAFSKINVEICQSAFDLKISKFHRSLRIKTLIYRALYRHGIKKILSTSRYTEYSLFKLVLTILFPFLKGRIDVYYENWNKEKYLRKLSKKGIKTPLVYQVVEDQEYPVFDLEKIKFPCICKPSLCSGGYGIFVAQNVYDLESFFGPETAPLENYDELDLFYRNRNKRGLRNYRYNSGGLGGSYIIQELVKGRVLSVSGVVIASKASSLFSYEIRATENAYCAEQAFCWPLEESLDTKINDIAQKIVLALNYPDGPFMADFILSESGDLHVIDAGPRASLTAALLSEWVFSNSIHAENLVSSHWGYTNSVQPSRSQGRAVFWQRFPFPKGKVRKMSYPDMRFDADFDEDSDAEGNVVVSKDLKVKEGDRIFEQRLDKQMADRGYLATTGSNLMEAEQNWYRIYNRIDWEIE